ncbi:unnamed protein product [Cylindrotheca closterium]|uniref:KNTC1 third ARM-repeats domain-containing protein n=1 Tax=Cylindrotheca closterium TaxID=2856 RepID=A0AAD2JI33_9STRA|nr:unnamed protein product [Cylindrotheca closterium]
MSKINRLSLDEAVDPDAQIAGWDQTIADKNRSSSWEAQRVSIASHAIAHRTVVCGTTLHDPNDNKWTKWKRSFAPHRVCRVACNKDGSIIAAAIDNGTVAVLKGSNGDVLASRRVASAGIRIPAEISFVRRSAIAGTQLDTLVVEPPEANVPAILVSHIDGNRLNNSEEGIVEDAVKCIVFHELKVKEVPDSRAIQGYYRSRQQVRFALVDGNGNIAIHDYNIESKTGSTITKDVSVGGDETENWGVDFTLGLRIQHIGSQHSFLLFAASSTDESQVGVYDLEKLKMAGSYAVSKDSSGNNTRTRILALEPVTSSAEVTSLAMVVATTSPSGKDGLAPAIKSRLIQGSVDEINGKIGELHPVYYIPVPNTVTSMSISPLPDEDKPYAFRCLTSCEQQQSMECHEFIPNGSSLGSIRLLARTNHFRQANVIVAEIGSQTLQADPFARFHPSEIALQELHALLSRGGVRDAESARLSRACLNQLSNGALSGNSLGTQTLLSAADAILNWPDEKAIQRGQTTLWDVVVGLQGIIGGIKPVSTQLSESSELDAKTNQLEERLIAMQYLQSIMGKNAPLNPQFASVVSVKHMFGCLVQSECFPQAEQLWRSPLQPKLSTEAMVTVILDISSQINPREYASLLSEVVVPSLSINHELLPPLLEWSCRMADDFDDAVEGDGLENAIFLLEILERGTKELRVNVHSSFASYTPFVDRIMKKKRRIGQKNSYTPHPMSADLSFSSVKSIVPSQQSEKVPTDERLEGEQTPAPTLLEFSTMRRGAQKARARRYSSIDTIDESEDCVESKLVAARCLKHARELGLEKKLITLRTYSSCGGAQFIAKDLVRLFSQSARDNKQRGEMLSSQFQWFCLESSANADKAIKQYTKDLCGGNMTTKRAVDESASLSQCCMATKTKCEVVLVTLRAAKFCHYSPEWLSKLSLDAIEWAAGDSALRSELEEASRLLLIDGIVGRYCGDAAKELFHVDNPRHAIRLAEFISHQRSIDESVLSDTLALCDAFGHLSKEEVCSRIIQNRLLEGEKDACSALMELLYRRNSVLAKNAFSCVISFCIDIIEEGPGASPLRKKQVMNATSCAFQLSKTALTYVHSHIGTNSTGYSSATYDEYRLQEMVEDFHRLEVLQTKHGIFLSFVDLDDPKVLVDNATRSMEPLVELYVQGDTKNSSTVTARAKQICSLLSGTSRISFSSLWLTAVGSLACKLAKKTLGVQCLEFLSDTGVLESIKDDLSSRCCLALALTFCGKALKQHGSFDIKSRMKFVVISNSLLRDLSITRCSPGLLASATATAELCDMTSQILARADEGVGEEIDEYRKMLHTFTDSKNLSNPFFTSNSITNATDSASTHLSPLHPTWYVGDGLLLPPSETLERGLEFCKRCLAKSSMIDAAASLYAFLEGRGAHSLALRLLTYSTVMGMCQVQGDRPDFQRLEALAATHTKSLVALTERSLGGSGNGILSGVVDSQLSGSFLLCLPLKKAFKVYKSSLPTAMSTRNFERLIKLASIGQAIGTSGILLPPGNSKLDKTWKRQQKFVSQCRQLALRAKWWKKLQSFEVQFDLYRFEQGSSGSKEEDRGKNKYPETLLPSLISKMTEKDIKSGRILQITSDFAEAFGLCKEIATKRYVEYLLCPVDSLKEKNGSKIRSSLSTLQALSETLIQQLASPLDRLKILRACSIRLEASANCQDYERLSIVLFLYRMELNSFLRTANEKHALYKPATIELELVGRRLEALALLSSFMQVENKQQRPTMDSLFRPLPLALDQMDPNASKVPRISILGGQEDGAFDPLRPLEDILISSCDKALSTLSSLCPLLGVPTGYLHARSLILRFKKSKLEGVSYPSFEGDVLPVLQKLKSADDMADLAEWCSKQYTFEDEDKLRSLDRAKNFAIQASIDAEKKSSTLSSQHEFEALERLKRIRSAKELLVDRLAINAILNTVGINSESFCTLSNIIDDLMKRLDEQVWSKSKFDPERFVEIFLTEASLLSAEASLCNQRALSIAKFRKLCCLVHQACKSVAERYSHVHVGTTIQKLAKQWLAHGDNSISSEDTRVLCDGTVTTSFAKNDAVLPLFPDIMQDEEDTMNFVMDLSSLKGETVWSANIGPSQNSELEEKKYTSEEEPSSLKFPGSSSEISDFNSRRTALRIAFVMAFTDGYEADEGHQDTAKENKESNSNKSFNTQGQKQKGKKGLLSKIGQSESEKRCVSVIEHSRDLLRVVFAKPGSSDALATGSFDGQNTVTFAMRHRALRAASILCPQQALEDVVDEESFLTAGTASSLKKCSFAAYVAKEIEELGLPLPHSDLSQLSTINFPSYARTLWRHHRDNRTIKGRLLLLIAEMYLKEPVQDYGFLSTVLLEVEKSSLPRSLLLILESASQYLERMDSGNVDSFFSHIGREIMQCMRSLEEMIGLEHKRLHDTKDESQVQLQDALATSKRMSALMKYFSHGSEGQQFLLQYVESQILLSEEATSKIEKKELLSWGFIHPPTARMLGKKIKTHTSEWSNRTSDYSQ